MFPRQSARPAKSSSAGASDKKPALRWGRAAYLALFIVLALTAAQSARLGGAGLLVQTAGLETDRWTAASRPPSMPEIGLAAKYYSDSLRYAADNPWALEGLGALDLASMRNSRSPREALAFTRDARLRFRQALVQRPTSPYLWANLALSKLYLDEIDDELIAALRHADELGPWEPASQQTTLFVGLAVWQELDSGLRQALAQTLERGGMRNARKMYEIVKSYGRFDLICAMKNYEAIAAADCKKLQKG